MHRPDQRRRRAKGKAQLARVLVAGDVTSPDRLADQSGPVAIELVARKPENAETNADIGLDEQKPLAVQSIIRRANGFLVALAGGAVSLAISKVVASPFLGAPVLALVIGLIGSIWLAMPHFAAGYSLAARQGLRVGVALLGIQVSLLDALSIGMPVLTIAIFCIALSVMIAILAGRYLRLSKPMALLLGFGTGICGASAILATAQIVKATEKEIAISLLVISVLGGVGVAFTPLALDYFELPTKFIGLWAGLSLQEVAHAVGAASLGGIEAGEVGTTAKLLRVLCLAPALIVLSLVERRGLPSASQMPPIVPLFVAAFISLAVVGSLVQISPVIKDIAWQVSSLLLASSLVAIGLQTRWVDLRSGAVGAFIHGGVVWLVLLGATFILCRHFDLGLSL